MSPSETSPSKPAAATPPPDRVTAPGRPACPYLGRLEDADTVFLQPHPDHRCHATEPAGWLGLDFQQATCFGEFRTCARFRPVDEHGRPVRPAALPAAAPPGDVPRAAAAPHPGGRPAMWRRFSFEEWLVYGVSGLLLLAILYFAFLAGPTEPPADATTAEPGIRARAAALNATTPPSATPRPTGTPPARLSTEAPAATVAVPTPPPGGLNAALSPSERGVASFNDQDRLAAFGERNLNVGRFQGRRFLGGMLFPLSRIPPGSRVGYVGLELTGLSDAAMTGPGTWTVELLDPEAADQWSNLTFETLAQAPARQMTTAWPLAAADLAPRRVNVLEFSDDARDLFMQRLAQGKIAFRIRGPDGSADNLFAWDTGFGEGFGTRPTLRVGFVPPPPTAGPQAGQPTAVPLVVWIADPTPAPTATALPGTAPAVLGGMVLFLSDRFGQTRLMVYDPATGRVGQVTQSWPYTVAKARQAAAAGVSAAVAGRTCGSGATPEVDGDTVLDPGDPVHGCSQIVVSDAQWPHPREITPPGYMHYDPAVSPDGQWIAYTSTIAGNDEIFKIRLDGGSNVRLTENVWEWDKHPSWSPDGARLAFYSNRDGRKQIYLMNADGSGLENVSQNAYNDWDPVWVR